MKLMNHKILVVSVIVFFSSVIQILSFAQNLNNSISIAPQASNQSSKINQVGNVYLPSNNFKQIQLKGLEVNEILAFIENELAIQLEFTNLVKSPIGEHYDFVQIFKGQEIYNSQVKLNLKTDGSIFSISGMAVDLNNWPAQEFENNFESKSSEFQNNIPLSDNAVLKEKKGNFWWANFELKELITVQSFLIEYPETGLQYHLLLDKDQNVIFEDPLFAFYHNHAAHSCLAHSNQDTTAQGLVFNPDPLSTAEVGYNGAYTDNNDNDNTALNNERVQVELDCEFENGNFVLKNQYLKIVNLAPPFSTPVTSSNGEFFYARSQSGFEEVNAFYHMTNFQKYMLGIGCTSLCSTNQIQVDAHGTDGDNSFFRYGDEAILFGDGGVDDAEDADVIIHEYGHAISNCAAPNSNFGGATNERNSLDEAYGDYLGSSYSRSLTEYNWENMFSWDGHNEYWSGRTVNSNNIYPDDLTSNIFNNAQIFSSALMEIWELLGRECADKIVLNSLFLNTKQTGFIEATNNIIELAADNNCSKDNLSGILEIFSNRGTFNINVDAGLDQEICRGDSAILSPYIDFELENLDVSWEGINIKSISEDYVAIVQPNQNTSYQLIVNDPLSSIAFYDTISVSVDHCTDIEGDIALVNSFQFFMGNEDPYLIFSDEISKYKVYVTNIAGQTVYKSGELSGGVLPLPLLSYPSGSYFVNVVAISKTDLKVLSNYSLLRMD